MSLSYISAIGCILAGTACLSGLGIWAYHWIKTISISEEEGYSTTYTDNTIGRKYGDYFLSSKNNQRIWKNKYEKYINSFKNDQSKKAKDKFGTVTVGYDPDQIQTALNKVCAAAYKAGSDSFADNLSSEDTTKYLKRNIWKFCSIDSLFTIEENKDTYKDQIGGESENKKILISVENKNNDWFWRIRSKEFWKENGERSKEKTTGSDEKKNVFKQLSVSNKTSWIDLKKACEKAYKQPTSDNNKNKEHALLFCSIKLDISNASA